MRGLARSITACAVVALAFAPGCGDDSDTPAFSSPQTAPTVRPRVVPSTTTRPVDPGSTATSGAENGGSRTGTVDVCGALAMEAVADATSLAINHAVPNDEVASGCTWAAVHQYDVLAYEHASVALFTGDEAVRRFHFRAARSEAVHRLGERAILIDSGAVGGGFYRAGLAVLQDETVVGIECTKKGAPTADEEVEDDFVHQILANCNRPLAELALEAFLD